MGMLVKRPAAGVTPQRHPHITHPLATVLGAYIMPVMFAVFILSLMFIDA